MTVRELAAQLIALPEAAQELLVLIAIDSTVGDVVVLDPEHLSAPAVALLHVAAGRIDYDDPIDEYRHHPTEA